MISIHKKAQERIMTLRESGIHSLLLYGPKGVGLSYIAKELCTVPAGGQLLWVRPEKEGVTEYDKGSIGVEQVRGLYDAVRTKVLSGRVVIIDAAEKMTESAQNAFLKLLEEPPQGTQFVLLSHEPDRLLATIKSRVQSVDVPMISDEQSAELLDVLGVVDEPRRTQLLFIANGLPAELTRLARDETSFQERVRIVKDARVFISGTAYDRLKVPHAYKDDRSAALTLVDDAAKQLRQAMHKRSDPEIVSRIEVLVAAYEAIRQNGNIRLQLAATLVI